ncbi:hypothetical protein SAMN05216486_10211 [bacterium JGI 053]|nr:hypothetical protein SAMN05216486_10211 [bacterium JGI 053]
MLVVISDLHLEEEESVVIDPTGKRVGRRRNLPAKPFIDFAARLAHDADHNRANRLDLVLAGDIFDIHRSGLWFKPAGGPMPWDAPVSPALGAKVLAILNAIESQDQHEGDGVHDALAVFSRLARGKYLKGGEEVDFPLGPAKIRIHYLTGNHDRLCNATDEIRARVREILGIPPAGPGERFPNQILFDDPPVLIRHGHEYEFTNFSVDNSKLKEIPLQLPQADYDAPAFGDLVTVQIASRLPAAFREHHGDAAILASGPLQHIYDRLIEFDDVRPQSALIEFVLNDPDVPRAQAWDAVEPVLRKILNELGGNAFLRKSLKARDKWGLDAIDLVQAILGTRAWELTRKLPLKGIEAVIRQVRGGVEKPPVDYAAREKVIRDGTARLLIAGHTHNPTVELAASDATHGERYYVDTGTWRNRVPSTPDGKGFGHLKALTYVEVYRSDEDQPSKVDDPRSATTSASDTAVPGAGSTVEGQSQHQRFSFDYWSGVTQRFGP